MVENQKFEDAIEAMNEILVRIGRLNDLIRAHFEAGDGNSVSVENWKEIKTRLTQDLADTLNHLNLGLRVELKLAA